MRTERRMRRASGWRRGLLAGLVAGSALAGLCAGPARGQTPPVAGATATLPPATATAAGSPAATPGAPPPTHAAGYGSAEAVLGDLVWARAVDPATKAPQRRATGFIITDPAIYVAIPVTRIAKGVQVSAAWSFNGAPIPALTSTLTMDQDFGAGWIEFHIDRPANEVWPVGQYEVVISVNGQAALSGDIEVRVPPA